MSAVSEPKQVECIFTIKSYSSLIVATIQFNHNWDTFNLRNSLTKLFPNLKETDYLRRSYSYNRGFSVASLAHTNSVLLHLLILHGFNN